MAWLDRATQRLAFLEEKEAAEESLIEFVRQAWAQIEPGARYVDGWHIGAICDHLEAVGDSVCEEDSEYDLNRLLINVPPGMMKSLLVSVFWPAWLWGPKNKPHLRFLCASHSQSLAIRDSTKMRRLVQSEWYQKRWGDRVKLTGDQNAKTKFETTATGFREAVAAGSITGARGDIVIIDDPHSVESAASDQMRESTKEWFLEAVPTRLNNPEQSAIVVIMQRLHEEDVSGLILSKDLGYEHVCLPMEFDPSRRCETSIGFVDPREEEGELLFPERFPREVVDRDKRVMGPYAVAGQFQQTPTPRGGGIIKREWWRVWDDAEATAQGVGNGAFPPVEFVLASLDTAYTEKQSNDPSALTIWGLWRDRGENPKLILMNAWAKHLELHGADMERLAGETEYQWRERTKPNWGLIEWTAHTCKRFRVDLLLIEGKASGISVSQELRRLHRHDGFGVRLIDPGRADKVARAYAVQALFADGLIYAPDRSWADQVITQFESFPKAKHDDLVDSSTQAINFFRTSGMLQRGAEIAADFGARALHTGKPNGAIYDV